MTDNAFTRELVHSCTVVRPDTTPSATGDVTPDCAGGSAVGTYDCLYLEQRTTRATHSQGFVFADERKLLFEPATPIQAGDCVTSVTLKADGSSVTVETLTVETITKHRDHKADHHIVAVVDRVG